ASLTKPDIENVRYGGTFTVMSNQATASLDPAAVLNGGTTYSLNWIYERLYALEPNENDIGSKLMPQLADSYKVSDDKMTYTITLKQGIKWHNKAPISGREFQASDVVCSYTAYMQPTSVL